MGADPCANHPEAAALALCRRCRTSLCDPCCTFTVNDDVWCEPCGRTLEEEEAKPRFTQARVVLAVGLTIATLTWIVPMRTMETKNAFPLYVLSLFAYVVVAVLASRRAERGELRRPEIARRPPGSPMPRNAVRP